MQCLLLLPIVVISLNDLSIEELVARHSSGVGLIHTADVRIEVYNHFRDSDEPLETWRWCLNGQVQRLQAHNLSIPAGEPGTVIDTYVDRHLVKSLENYEPGQQLSLNDQQRVKARQYPYSRKQLQMRCKWAMLLGFKLTANDQERTLKELLADSLRVELIGSTKIGTHTTIQLRFFHPGVEGKYRGSYIDVFLDPLHAYMARKVVSHVNKDDPRDSVPWYENVRTVKSFEAKPGGSFFPQSVEETLLDPTRSEMRSQTFVVTSATINEPLSDDALSFVFPENVLVQVPADKPNKNIIHVIGKNNEVLARITTREELESLQAQERRHEVDRASDWYKRRYLVAGIIFIATLVIGGLVYFGRRKRQGV